MSFDATKWLNALQEEFDALIKQSLGEFRQQLSAERLLDEDVLAGAFDRIVPRTEKAVKVNIDKLEEYHRINSPTELPPGGEELLRALQDVQKDAGDPAPHLEKCLAGISDACKTFHEKRQQYLLYCLYDRYNERERAVWSEVGGTLDLRVREDAIFSKVARQREFLEEFDGYLVQFQRLQDQLSAKISNLS